MLFAPRSFYTWCCRSVLPALPAGQGGVCGAHAAAGGATGGGLLLLHGPGEEGDGGAHRWGGSSRWGRASGAWQKGGQGHRQCDGSVNQPARNHQLRVYRQTSCLPCLPTLPAAPARPACRPRRPLLPPLQAPPRSRCGGSPGSAATCGCSSAPPRPSGTTCDAASAPTSSWSAWWWTSATGGRGGGGVSAGCERWSAWWWTSVTGGWAGGCQRWAGGGSAPQVGAPSGAPALVVLPDAAVAGGAGGQPCLLPCCAGGSPACCPAVLGAALLVALLCWGGALLVALLFNPLPAPQPTDPPTPTVMPPPPTALQGHRQLRHRQRGEAHARAQVQVPHPGAQRDPGGRWHPRPGLLLLLLFVVPGLLLAP